MTDENNNTLEPPPQPSPDDLVYFAGGQVDEACVSLRFFGDDLNPDWISQLLRLQPSLARRKGDVIPDKRYYRTAKTGIWLLSGTSSNLDLAEQIGLLFDQLPADPQIWQQLRPYKGELFCGLWIRTWNRGLVLSSELVQQIAEKQLALDFDIYNEAEETEPES